MAPADDRRLLIKAKGGLGNRILSAIGGLIYADLSGRTPIIDWRDGAYAPRGTNAYPLLFESPPGPQPEAVESETDVSPQTWAGALSRHPSDMIEALDPRQHSNPFIYRRFCVDLRRLDTRSALAVYWCYLPKFARMRGIMSADARFRGRRVEDVCAEYLERYFTPNETVRRGVAAAVTDAHRPVLGVHIRYSDMKVPLDKIEDSIDAVLREDPRFSVFLATDNLDVQKRIERKYDRVFSIEKWFPEAGGAMHQNDANPDKTREAENALIDMWALARCDRLIYSGSSTFSYTSRLIGRFADSDATDVDRFSLKIRIKRLFRDHA